MNKQEQHVVQGLQRDLSVSKFNPNYAFDAFNIRITARENSSLYSVTNEKGTKEIPLRDTTGASATIEGTIIGHSVLNNYAVLFTSGTSDRIYRVENKIAYFEVVTLFSGSLGFEATAPIETLSVYENEDIQKVYWIDGLHQTRVVNIVTPADKRAKWNNRSFDFVQDLLLNDFIEVEKTTLSSGRFAAGVIQYAFTYYNLYGQETNIFNVTPIQYISYVDRGASPEDIVNVSFKITANNLDTAFDYVRIYSIHRTSLDATPVVKSVVDLPIQQREYLQVNAKTSGKNMKLSTTSLSEVFIYDGYSRIPVTDYPNKVSSVGGTIIDYYVPCDKGYIVIDIGNHGVLVNRADTMIVRHQTLESGTVYCWVIGSETNDLSEGGLVTSQIGYITYTDTGNIGTTVDPTELLYKGGEDIVFKTMTQKDNTLFLGNAKLNRKLVSSSIKNLLKDSTFVYTDRTIKTLPSTGDYPYENTLSFNAQITTFKRFEWYRIGVQLQYRNGKWSEPIFRGDFYNTDTNELVWGKDYVLVGGKLTLSQDFINSAVNEGFVRARAAVVFPSPQERESIAQGIVCPTVYNIGDRYDNSPFAQASWFSRPIIPYDTLVNPDYLEYWETFGKAGDYSVHSEAGFYWNNKRTNVKNEGGTMTYSFDVPNYGAWAKFKHNDGLPPNWERNCEIQCNVLEGSAFVSSNTNISTYVDEHRDCFLVDQSIVTLHSPDIELGEVTNVTGLKFRLLGLAPISSNMSDIDIQATTPPVAKNSMGFWKKDISVPNRDDIAFKGLVTGVYWYDSPYIFEEPNYNAVVGYAVYPWHRNGALNRTTNTGENAGSAHLRYKKISNLKFSDRCMWFVDPWNAEIPGSPTNTGISGAEIFNSNEQTLIKIPAPKNSNLRDLSYYGNIDKVIAPSLADYPITIFWQDAYSTDKNWSGNSKNGYPIIISANVGTDEWKAPKYSWEFWGDLAPVGAVYNVGSNPGPIYGTEPVSMKYKSSPHAVMALNYTEDGRQVALPKIQISRGNAILNKAIDSGANNFAFWDNTLGVYLDPDTVTYELGWIQDTMTTAEENAIFADATNNNKFWYSPAYNTLKRCTIVNTVGVWGNSSIDPNMYFFKSIGGGASKEYYRSVYAKDGSLMIEAITGIHQDTITYVGIQNEGTLYIGELYQDNVPNRFGGQSEEAIESNLWLPAGNPVSIISGYNVNNDPIPSSTPVDVLFTEGDTFYQRFDTLRTYPYTLEDQNSIVDIVSFMCETRINLDGRYDRNRGQKNNLTMTPENFNKVNPIYSQKNNFFNYRGFNSNRFSLDYFPNTVTWTKEKQLGALTDSWTNITMASTLDLDGDKGEVVSLNTFNNEIFCFQRNGLSNILFNSRVQIPTSDGLPIEITNGMKVNGKRYISNMIGCTNKWSITETPSGLYFIDNQTNAIYRFNGQIENLSDKLGFRQWIGANNSQSSWNPLEFNNFRGFYDKNNDDVYFIGKDTALCYSELLGQFTSFMSYEGVPSMFNINSEFYSVKNNKLWEHFSGEYNSFYGVTKPYWLTIVANAEEPYDKIYNVVEFRADSWNGSTLLNTTFDTLEVWNEYQKGTVNLVDVLGHSSPLKRKFRVWRALAPRDGVNKQDRIRNTWAYVKLAKMNPSNERTEFHDMIVHYFV